MCHIQAKAVLLYETWLWKWDKVQAIKDGNEWVKDTADLPQPAIDLMFPTAYRQMLSEIINTLRGGV